MHFIVKNLTQYKRQRELTPGKFAKRINRLFAEVGGADDLADALQQQPKTMMSEPLLFTKQSNGFNM